jgi:hypothetical protein
MSGISTAGYIEAMICLDTIQGHLSKISQAGGGPTYEEWIAEQDPEDAKELRLRILNNT